MAPITSKLEKIGVALTAARAAYAKSNPKSFQIHSNSTGTLPGGKNVYNNNSI
jgi:hypothetical protein